MTEDRVIVVDPVRHGMKSRLYSQLGWCIFCNDVSLEELEDHGGCGVCDRGAAPRTGRRRPPTTERAERVREIRPPLEKIPCRGC